MGTNVKYELRDHTAFITLNRPEALNSLNTPLRRELSEAWHRFRDEPDAWVAVISGTGEKAFSAGADLKEMSQRYTEGMPDDFWETPNYSSLNRGFDLWKPVIAAINGYALGGGLELAMACDVRIAADHAQLGLTEVTRGIIPGGGGTQRLPRLVPFGIAMQLLMTGERISAQRALDIGLVNEVVPLAELMPAAERLARRICENAPLAVRAAKESAYRGTQTTLADGLRIEQYFMRIIRTTSDSREGPKAFSEKRTPQWQGR
ncbi:MAG: enoyl-CoA hydratase/isomerase family protein [Chloroflexi bacterium]|nr:enoyl-CoA hydratase/isomerase family protein [Chloroflexota bacterium]